VGQGHNFEFYLRVIELESYDIHGFGHGLAENLKSIYIRCEHLHLEVGVK
jgi:hypothetical protein